MKKQIYVTYSDKCIKDHTERHGKGEFDFSYESWYEFELKKAYGYNPGDPYHESFEIEVPENFSGKIYVVTVIYTTGDTFGTSHGKGCIEGVYTDRADAEAVKDSIHADTYNPGNKYAAWIGFFESLEHARVEELKVNER